MKVTTNKVPLEDFIKMTFAEITPQKLSDISDEELLNIHRRLHQWWGKNVEKYTQEDVIGWHVLVVREMKKRGLKHRIMDNLDKHSQAQEKGKMKKELFEMVKNLRSLVYVPDFISIVGSSVKSDAPEDIDICIRAEEWRRDKSLELRISRLFPKEIRENLHFIWNPQGPHDDYIPLFSLGLFKYPELRRHYVTEMIDEVQKKLKLFSKFKPLKPSEYASRFFELDELMKWWLTPEKLKIGVVVEEKFDGLRVICQRDGDKVLIYFEDAKKDRSKYLPSIVKALKSLPCNQVILDGELLEKKGDQQVPRKDLVRWATSNDPGSDSGVFIHFFDILYLDGKALNQMPLLERKKYLKQIIKGNGPLKQTKYYICNTVQALKRASNEVSHIKYSEGAMFKLADSVYNLTGSTTAWTKLKMWKVVNVLVSKINQTKKKNIINCDGLIGPLKNEEKEKYQNVEEYNGKYYVKIGRTYNINVRETPIKVGDIIEVYVAEIKLEEEDGKKKITWDNPVFRGTEPGKKEPYSIREVEKLAKSGRGSTEVVNSIDSFSTLDISVEELLQKALTGEEGGAMVGEDNPYRTFLGKGKKTKFVLQEHIRGLNEEEIKVLKKRKPSNFKSFQKIKSEGLIDKTNSSHLDLRVWMPPLKAAIGFTLDTPGNTDPKSKYKVLEGLPTLCELKKLIPPGWLNPNNFPYIANPGEVGATANTYGYLYDIEHSQVEYYPYGHHFLEFIFHGKYLNGRYILTYVPVKDKRKRIWVFSKPKNQEPYYKKHPEALEKLKSK